MQFRLRKKRRVLINITPLIDVLFLLLIFLMVSSTFLDQPGIKLELPQADSSVIVEQKDYVLFVNKAGKMFLNDLEVDFESLQPLLKKMLPEMKDGSLILNADQEISHGIVVKIMDIVKKSGIKKLIIGTKLED